MGKQHSKAKQALEKGDPEPMQVFYNTRLALCWDNAQERTRASDLKDRSEQYLLRSVPNHVLILTAAIDVQSDRLELQIQGWGEGLESWVLDYQAIQGDPSDIHTWNLADEVLRTPLRRSNGRDMFIDATAVDSGGHHTQEVYDYTRLRKYRKVFAVKGASKSGRPVIPNQPTKADVNIRGKYEKRGVELWMVGTDTAKDWIFNRFKLSSGPGAMHFSRDLPADYFDQITSERKLVKYVKGHKRVEYVKGKSDRNEALDLTVYNLAAAHRLGLHK
ncbi:terminase gpA endonuclease subunit, partial [uncultured Arthrobacter sp.]|uniref:terminase gpA endonuclease subunit n=1 Tax=uncultured Arthrobacter sp. TaxID=114050 RepID=UPI003216FCD1